MNRRAGIHIDTVLALLLTLLVVGGAFVFASAAFGLLARGSVSMSSVVFGHLVLGVGVGLIALFLAMLFDYRLLRSWAPYLFGAALIVTALVFTPIGMAHGGGNRWIVVAGHSFQPSEALKIAAIIMAAAYFSSIHKHIHTLKYGIGGLLGVLVGPVILLVKQPDLGTLGVICFSVMAIFWAAGARVRDILLVVTLGIVSIAALAFFRPYVMDRVTTFLHPANGQQEESYQIKQSLIAIGSGGFFGRGFGQGIQKFRYLPEPMGDSIFAVAGEELGFVGTVSIVCMFLLFGLRGYIVASRSPDMFGALLAVGISTYLVCEAFINIASMLGVAPLTGIPLTFVSQGGSAMLFSLLSAGILLSVSRHRVLNR